MKGSDKVEVVANLASLLTKNLVHARFPISPHGDYHFLSWMTLHIHQSALERSWGNAGDVVHKLTTGHDRQLHRTIATDTDQVIVLQRKRGTLNPIRVSIHSHHDLSSLHPGDSHSIIRATEGNQRPIIIERQPEHGVIGKNDRMQKLAFGHVPELHFAKK